MGPEPMGAEDCPYPGLVAFGPQQAAWFFGRDQAIDDLIRKLAELPAGGGPLTVVAPSGAGTSSLLVAGLVPALAGGEKWPGSESWPRLFITLGADPLADFATQVAEQTGADPAAVTAATADPRRFTDFLTEKVAAQGRRKQGATSSPARVMLIVDQFEKTMGQEDAERRALVAALCTAAQNDAVLVVLGLRADFSGSYQAAYTVLQRLRPAWPAPDELVSVILKPMSRDQLREIITKPAEAKGLEVAPGLVDRLLSDLGITGAGVAGYHPGALPLLAYALRATWKQRSGRMLTVADYERTDDIPSMLAATAEMVYDGLSVPEQQIAEQILPYLVQVDAQTGEVCRPVPRVRLLQALPGAAEKVLETFGKARLLTFDDDNGVGNVKITHKDLPRVWPRLAGWISADHVGLHTYRSLCEDAAAWEASEHNSARLAANHRLAIYQDWATVPGRKARLNASQEAYLNESIDKNKHEQQAGRRHLYLGMGALLAVVVLLVGGIGFQRYYTERTQRDLTLASKLAATSRSLAATQPYAAMLLAVEAFHLASAPETRGALLSAQSQYLAGHLAGQVLNGQVAGHFGTIHSVIFSRDGSTLATAGDDSAVRLWDVASHQPRTPLEGRADSIVDAEFSPDDRFVATAGKDGTVRLWDVDRHQLITTLRTDNPGQDLHAVTFSHDGRILAAVGDDGATRLWDVDRRRDIVTLPGHGIPVYGVEFSPDNQVLATAGRDGTARLWDAVNHQLITTLSGHTGPVNTAAFSPDGRVLMTVGDDKTVKLWDVASRQPIATMIGHTGPVNSAAFSPDGHSLVTGSRDGTARLWDVVTRQQVGILAGTSSIIGVAFSPDGRTVATAGEDAIARLWDTGGPILHPLPPAIGHDVVFSPDGRVLITAGDDGSVRLWEVASRRRIVTLTGHTGGVYAAAFSSDGRTLVTAGDDGIARLWDVANHQLITTFDGRAGVVRSVAFSPDGRSLVIAGDDGVARLWDMDNHYQPINYRATDHQPIATFDGRDVVDRGVVRSVAFSPDGRSLVIAGDDATVRLWDVANRQHIATLIEHAGAINKVVFSPSGHILVTVGDDGTARLWDTARLRDPVEHQSIATLTGHVGRIHTAAFSRDGHTLVTASSDGMAKLWNVASQQLIATLTGHVGVVYGAAFNPDGLLATVGGDRTVRLWDLDVDRVTTRICEIIRPVSREQWVQLTELDYQPTCR
ncbi:MAG: WD40 repeat domain-containing protein [Pseudonocardiaceae bacterium]